MTNKPWWAPLTGVLFVVLVIVSFIVAGEPPDVDEGAQKIVEHYQDNDDHIFLGAIISGYAAVLFVFFAGILRSVLREAEGEHGQLSLVAFAGAVIIVIGAAIDGTISIALAETIDDIEPASALALQALWENDFLPFAVGSAVFTWAVGLSILRHGAFPKWMGWIGVVLAVVSITPAGFVAFLGIALWIIAMSVMLTLRARAAPGAPAA